MTRLLPVLMLSGASLFAQAQPPAPILLWTSSAPGALGNDDTDKPTITPYVVSGERATGTAVIVVQAADTATSPWKRKGAMWRIGGIRWA